MTENENKIQEMQFLDQSLQNLMMQKQSLQIELSETQSALKEVKNAGDEVYKIIGQLMIKSDKARTLEDLKDREKMLELKIKAFEKQESSMAEKIEKLREEITKSLK